MASTQKPAALPQEPLTPKIQAWAYVREVWTRYKRVTQELLDAEEDAKETN